MPGPATSTDRWFAGADKVVHEAMYAGLGFTAAGALGVTHAVGAGLAAFGGVDEWHQQFIPRRDASVGDWLADVVGVMLGMTGFRALRARRSGVES